MPLDLVGILKAASGSPQRWEKLDLSIWQAIQEAGGKRWRKGDARIGSWRLLVGIASYSEPDLELAERLIKLPHVPDHVIEFFNVLDIKDMQGFEDYIPGVGNVWGTPVVGLWRDGIIERAAHGADARRLLQGLFPEGDQSDTRRDR